jgi:hypothetical protein
MTNPVELKSLMSHSVSSFRLVVAPDVTFVQPALPADVVNCQGMRPFGDGFVHP